ncbi:MAG: hypothetical protein SAK29_33825 [Scytonema sp. PMC 1069.18]|nr:hypothetical protein [Scytonema sp. PMC 1069.18]
MPKISIQEASELLGVHPDQNKALIEELEKSAQKISETCGIDGKYSCIILISIRKQGGGLTCP